MNGGATMAALPPADQGLVDDISAAGGERQRRAVAKAITLLESTRAEGERAEAVDCAKAAAPYVHPKLAPTSPPTPVHEPLDYNVLSETELEQLDKIYSKLLNRPAASETPPAQSRVMRGRYSRAVSSGAQ